MDNTLDATLLHPAVSRELMRLPATTGEAIDDAVSVLVSLMVPFQLYGISRLFIGLPNGGDYNGLRDITRTFATRHWNAFLDMLDAALGSSPTVRP